MSQIVPEGDAELGAGLGETEEGIAAVAPGIAAGAAADLALGDVAADVVLRTVGVQRALGPIEDNQQFGLVGVQPLEQAVEGNKAGCALEDPIEARPQGGLAPWRRILAVSFQIGIEPPDQRPDALLGGAVAVGEGVELVDQALGVDPAQSVPADVELAGAVADDHAYRAGSRAP